MIPHSCPKLGKDEVRAAREVIESLYVKGGPRREALEKQVATDQAYRHAIATTCGTQAIHIAIRGLFPEGGARIVIADYLCRSVYDAVMIAGCEPVLVDIDPTHLSPDVEKTKVLAPDAVVVAHICGIRAPIELFMDAGLTVIEDCAQRIAPAELAVHEARGTVRILSLEATKIVTSGEGGIFLCDDDDLAARCRHLRDGGYDSPEVALWLPMTDIQAAIGLVQWRRLPEFLKRRRELLECYLGIFDPDGSGPVFPAMRLDNTLATRFLLVTNSPDALILASESLSYHLRKPVAPITLHNFFDKSGDFPASENAISSLVSLPLYPSLNVEQIKEIGQAIQSMLDRQI